MISLTRHVPRDLTCISPSLTLSVVKCPPPIRRPTVTSSATNLPPRRSNPSSPRPRRSSSLRTDAAFTSAFQTKSVPLVSPVPEPSLSPPMKWWRSRSWSHTVISAQASRRSSARKPSYTMVWLNMGLAVLFTTRVFCRLFLLVSGRTALRWKTIPIKRSDWETEDPKGKGRLPFYKGVDSNASGRR